MNRRCGACWRITVIGSTYSASISSRSTPTIRRSRSCGNARLAPHELPADPVALKLTAEGAVLGLNQDFPLLLTSVLEHGAANFGDVPLVSVGRDETIRLTYRTAAARARRLAS